MSGVIKERCSWGDSFLILLAGGVWRVSLRLLHRCVDSRWPLRVNTFHVAPSIRVCAVYASMETSMTALAAVCQIDVLAAGTVSIMVFLAPWLDSFGEEGLSLKYSLVLFCHEVRNRAEH